MPDPRRVQYSSRPGCANPSAVTDAINSRQCRPIAPGTPAHRESGRRTRRTPGRRQHRIAHQRRSTHRVEDRAEQAVDEVGLRRRQRVARCRRQRDHHRSVRAPRVRLVEDLGQQLSPGRGQVVRLVQHECERLGAVQRVDDLPGRSDAAARSVRPRSPPSSVECGQRLIGEHRDVGGQGPVVADRHTAGGGPIRRSHWSWMAVLGTRTRTLRRRRCARTAPSSVLPAPRRSIKVEATGVGLGVEDPTQALGGRAAAGSAQLRVGHRPRGSSVAQVRATRRVADVTVPARTRAAARLGLLTSSRPDAWAGAKGWSSAAR